MFNDNIEKLIVNTKGFLDPAEGRCLYEIATIASNMGPCLEIGSYCGKSTIYLGSACKKQNTILYSVDHHRGSEEQQPGEEYFDPDLFDAPYQQVNTFNEFRNTLEQALLEETVVPVVCRSEVAARQWSTPLSLVFIDGGHTQEAVTTDYHCWAPHVLPGGYLLIHDIFADPAEGGQAPFLIYREALASGLYTEMPMVKSLGVLKKKWCRV